MQYFTVRFQSKINKILHSPNPVQSKSSPVLISVMQYCSWKLHFTAFNWSNEIWQDAIYAIHCMKQTENMKNLNSIKSQLHYHHATYYSCSYVVNFSHEYFMETDLHLQISLHQASLKHENFTLSYHSYTTLKHENFTLSYHSYTTN